MNNGVLGMVRQWQTMFYDKHYMATSPDRQTDYVKVAEGFGLKGFRAETPAAFEEAFSQALASDTACWIDASINEDELVLPMIPAGASVHEMIF